MKRRTLFTILLSLPFILVSCNSRSPSKKEEKEFVGITFEDETFKYDGNYHSIYCDNVPSFATVTYVGNSQKEVGEYIVYATISATDYKNLNLSATMTIEEGIKHFENLKFNSLTVEYDGNPHTITVENVPSFATVIYSNNSKTGVGTYNAKATVSAEGYYTENLSATLKITAKTFKGITFKNQTIPYDGNYHSIYVEGAPEFATVTYSGNNKKEVGTYSVSATVKATGYNTLTLNATMKIAKLLPKIDSLVDRTLIYDGTAQLVSFTYPDDLPKGTEATFKVDNQTIKEKNDVRVTSIGEHTVSVTLTNETYNYEPSTTTAKIKVVKNTIGTIDSTKNPLKITSKLKYQTLRNEILKGNFTVKEEYYDDKYYPSGAEEHSLGHTSYTYVDNNEAFSFYDSYDREDSTYKLNENAYTHTKIIGDNVLVAEFNDGLLDKEYNCTKYPSYMFKENIIGEIGIRSMAYLDEGEDGGFIDGKEGGYRTKYGSYTIDETNNQFVMSVVIHYYHTEFDHDERTVYTIYNIGNTKINMLDEFKVDNISEECFKLYRFKYNGFGYYFDGTKFTATTSFDSVTCAYLDKGSYIAPAVIEGFPVSRYTVGYYDKYFDKDCSGYTIKLYCDSQGYYQEPYSDIGKITDFKYLGVFEDDGGNILYHGEW